MSTPSSDANDSAPAETSESLFYQAIDLPPEEREAFLDRACGTDKALHAEVLAYLHHYHRAGSFLKEIPGAASDLPTELARLKPEQAGERIGPYKLLEQIGEGGFGTVWVAEQEQPIRRRVALKIIKLGMDTKDVVARFEQERQALAMMDHPNIARVLDAGATPFGRPFFVMELVPGTKITDYCDQAKLRTHERLRLFIEVCHAVQHAHQKGIIHRDLKPSNILVTLHDGVPVPKVIDFGVAKATQKQRFTDLTIYTQFEQMIGTPLYMSPEQAELSGLDIDTRSDIYSLGVLLYEILTGRTPFDPEHLMQQGYDEIRRVIREDEPPKPSTLIGTLPLGARTTLALHRQTDSARFIGQIRGDLDWIVMKALEKDRTRRYETALGFARDIERHLESEPVHARPPTASYRFRRFARRNKLVLAAAAAVTLALIFGVAGVAWQAMRVKHEAARANAALAELRATAPAFAEQARVLVGKERFDEAIEKLEYANKLRPDVIDYILMKADLLESQFRFEEAAANYHAALRLKPSDARASTNASLCDKLALETAAQPKLSHESLALLSARMEQDGRSVTERMRVVQILGEEKKLLMVYWLERLRDLPLSPEKPLAARLQFSDNGRLDLDLSETSVSDLSPLKGMPLNSLLLNGCQNVRDLSPLRGMPLQQLSLGSTRAIGGADVAPCMNIHDLSPLHGLPLKELNLGDMRLSDLWALRDVPLESLVLSGTYVHDLEPLRGMPLKVLVCNNIPATDFSPISATPLRHLELVNSEVTDLSFLRALPVTVLGLHGCDKARGFKFIAEAKNLEVLTLPSSLIQLPEEELAGVELLRNHQWLKRIQFGDPGGGPVKSKTDFWRDFDQVVQSGTALSQTEGKERAARVRKAADVFRSKLSEAENLARAGKFKEAAEVTRSELAPEADSAHCMILCAELAAAGDRDGYLAAAAEMRRRYTNPSRSDDAERTIISSLLLPGLGAAEKELAGLLAVALRQKTHWVELAAGLADYRASRWDSAADWLIQCRARQYCPTRCEASVAAVLAMTEYRRGRKAEAIAALAFSQKEVAAAWPAGPSESWNSWLIANILTREAEALVR